MTVEDLAAILSCCDAYDELVLVRTDGGELQLRDRMGTVARFSHVLTEAGYARALE